ncbi:MAG: hypothetical protein WBG42_11240 [Cryomorphaceae bacterium]
MKHTILLGLFMAASFFGYSQKVKMSKDARSNYVKEETSEEVKQAEMKMTVYTILTAETEPGSEFFQVKLATSPRELETKASSMKFPELENLTRSKFSSKSEIDLLNYLAELDWEVVSIVYEKDEKKMNIRKYYLRKVISL